MSLPLDLKGPMTASNIKCGRNQGYDPDDGSQKAIQLSACLLEHSNMDPEQLCKALWPPWSCHDETRPSHTEKPHVSVQRIPKVSSHQSSSGFKSSPTRPQPSWNRDSQPCCALSQFLTLRIHEQNSIVVLSHYIRGSNLLHSSSNWDGKQREMLA